MSVIGKKPYVSEVLDSCTKSQLNQIHSLMNSLDTATPTFISLNPLSSHPITVADKGISFVSFQLDTLLNIVVSGILVYTDDHCALFGQDNVFPSVIEYEIDVENLKYTQIYENLTAEELRRATNDNVVNIEVADVEAGDVNSDGASAGQVLTADGNGGTSWEDVSGGTKLYRHALTVNSSYFLEFISTYEEAISTTSILYQLYFNVLMINPLYDASGHSNWYKVIAIGGGGAITYLMTSSSSAYPAQVSVSSIDSDTVTEL